MAVLQANVSAQAGLPVVDPSVELTASAEAEGLDLVVSWALPLEGEVRPDAFVVHVYHLDSYDEYPASELVRTVEVSGDQSEAVVSGLPTWEKHRASVGAVYGDRVVWADTDVVRILSTLSIVDTTPIVQTGDGPPDYMFHGVKREAVLDAPMPVDVWIEPVVLVREGEGLPVEEGGVPDEDKSLPVGAETPFFIPAGETHTWIMVGSWGDPWRRFSWARKVVSIKPSGPNLNSRPQTGEVKIAPDAQLSFTVIEDDVDVVPEVFFGRSVQVRAGRTARVAVRLDHPVSRRTVAHVHARDLRARAGRDYRFARTRVVIPRGKRVVWIEVPTRKRPGVRGVRQFEVQIARAENGVVIGKRARTTVRIRG